jgi:DeoR/GlpR family transcriptional regulator of sugar metabolism
MQTSEDVDLVDDRHRWLLEQLAEQRRITTNAAADELGVSVDTVRRDLRALHDRGLLRRVHGGAVQLSPLSPSFSGRANDHSPERARLANAVAESFQAGQVIGLDAGTTTTAIAAAIPQSLEVTIVTNNPAAAIALGDHRSASVILLGGDVDLRWMATTGAATVDAIRSYQFDLAVIGACSYDLTVGATTRSQYEVETKRAMITAAAETLIPLESTKLGTVAPFRIAGPTDAGIAVVGESVGRKTIGQWRAAGVDVTSI